MKIELKNTDFKALYEWLVNHTDISTPVIGEIIDEQLRPQYEKAFLRYQDETQKFKLTEKVQFRWPRDKNLWNGIIYKVSRLSNGQYKYIIKYLEPADDYHHDIGQIDEDGNGYNFTNPMVEKNIRKL